MNLLWSILPLLASCLADKGVEAVAKENARLEGTWIVTGVTIGGHPQDLSVVTLTTWKFMNGRYSAVGKKEQEAGGYSIDPSKSPKHLDLITTFNNKPITFKCIYTLEGDELKIGFTWGFVPGTPEDEAKVAKDMAATRPKKFDGRVKDFYTVMAWTLKRKL